MEAMDSSLSTIYSELLIVIFKWSTRWPRVIIRPTVEMATVLNGDKANGKLAHIVTSNTSDTFDTVKQ